VAAHLPADNFAAHFADDFLDEAMMALIATDAARLRQLAVLAPAVAAPRSRAAYVRKHAAFAALLKASARNLRFLRRVTQKRFPDLYAPGR
jgi:hypothetical protein